MLVLGLGVTVSVMSLSTVVMMVWISVVLIYLFGKLSEVEAPSEGYMFTVYPWLTTLPETVSTAVYALRGFYTTAIVNSVYSAAFDIFAAFGLSTLVHGDTELRVRDLALLACVSAALFMVFGADGSLGLVDGSVLLIVLFAMMLYSVYRYGWARLGLSGIGYARVVVGLAGLGVSAFVLASYVEALIPYLGEYLAGIISAALTSLPDLIVAVIYGVRSSYSQAQILGCIAHDFIENAAIAAVVTGLAGGALIDLNPVRTFAVTAVTVSVLGFAASYGRVSRFEALMVIIAYIIASIIFVW